MIARADAIADLGRYLESARAACAGIPGGQVYRMDAYIEAFREMREALEWMAGFPREYLDVAKTLHYDMNGRARRVLGRDAR